MAVYVKVGAVGGGSWRQIADGNIRYKKPSWDQDPNTWFVPTKVYVLVGNLGNGSWRDAAYASYPNPPTTPWVVAWNYGATHTGFYGPTSGPPVQDYHVERLDYWGTPIEGYYQPGGERVWGTPQDTQHQFRARSRGVNGLHSAWSGNLRVGIGHPETYNYGWVERSRGWYQQIDGIWYRDWWIAIPLPSRVLLTAMHYSLMTPQSSILSTGYSNRSLTHVMYDQDWGDMPRWDSPLYWIEYGYYNWGDGRHFGVVPIGSGWGTGSNSYYGVHGALGLEGTEYYDNWEHISTNPGQANYYW